MMNSSSVSVVIVRLWILGIAMIAGCVADTITFQPGLSYSWIIPPLSPSSSQAHQDRPSDDTFDQRNESPIVPIGGYGHPPFYLRHSHEQLSLPNEFLISPSSSDTQRNGGGGVGRGFSPMPIFRQLDPVDCDGDPTCSNFDIAQQQQQQPQRPTTIHQSNIAAVPSSSSAITPSVSYQQQPQLQSDASLGQPVSWPSSLAGGGGGSGGIGLLFFVPESASHLPVEQLIRQQLALHRTQFPIDISINCEDAVGSGCRGRGYSRSRSPSRSAVGGLSPLLLLPPSPPLISPATTVNERNAENGNYASLPLDEIDNGSSNGSGSGSGSRGGLDGYEQNRKWRTIGERLVRSQLEQRQRQQQLQQWQLQQNQQELSIVQ